VAGAAVMWLALAPPAWAQEEACGGVLREEELHDALDAAEAALVELNVDRADRILDDVVGVLRCVAAPLSPDDLGRLARPLAVVAFYDADPEELRSWTWLERDTVGGAWPEAALPVPPAFHALRAELSEPPLVRAEGGWLPPKKGAVLVDGRPSVWPEARSEVPHLLQMVDKKGRVVWSGWMLGADAPERWIDPSGGAVEVPRWVVSPPPPAPWGDGVASADPVPDPNPPEEAAPVGDGAAAAEPVSPEEAATAPGDAQGEERSRRPRRTTAFMEVFPDCPWRRAPTKVTVQGTTVHVNRHSYPARTAPEVAELQRVFRQCGEFRAARRLARWAEARGAWFKGAEARKQRDAMVRVLLADEPTRRP